VARLNGFTLTQEGPAIPPLTFTGFEQKENPTKLRPEDIAHMVKAILEMDDRGFTPELSVFATNPRN
jgi:hypothetical protein